MENNDRSHSPGGPGTYDNDYKKFGHDLNKMTIRGKPKDLSSNDNPGPGSYENNVNPIKDKVISHDMGKSPGKHNYKGSLD